MAEKLEEEEVVVDDVKVFNPVEEVKEAVRVTAVSSLR